MALETALARKLSSQGHGAIICHVQIQIEPLIGCDPDPFTLFKTHVRIYAISAQIICFDRG
jgi:hypothetical protein